MSVPTWMGWRARVRLRRSRVPEVGLPMQCRGERAFESSVSFGTSVVSTASATARKLIRISEPYVPVKRFVAWQCSRGGLLWRQGRGTQS